MSWRWDMVHGGKYWLGRGCARCFLRRACESHITMACSLAASEMGNHVWKAIKKPMTKLRRWLLWPDSVTWSFSYLKIPLWNWDLISKKRLISKVRICMQRIFSVFWKCILKPGFKMDLDNASKNVFNTCTVCRNAKSYFSFIHRDIKEL